MGYLHEGKWTNEDQFPTDTGGSFVRAGARFRASGAELLGAEPGRYHLYLAHACPWCQRTAIARELKGLQHRVTVSFVEPLMLEGGWRFSSERPDPLFGSAYVHELYTRADGSYTGRATVPILWDRQQDTIVCNESEDIVRLFDRSGVGPLLRPEPLAAELDELNALVYRVNNGVYRCGFARTQQAYEAAFGELFEALDALTERLSSRRFLAGEALTEADIRLFVTLVRFDAVYFGHFKCNRERIEDNAVLQRYLERLYAMPAFRQTTHIDEIKLHYYGSHRTVNPTGIVPAGPRLKLLELG